MSKIKPILIVLALLAAGAAATALATSWDFEGAGTGEPIQGTAVPFNVWEGTLYYSEGTGYFEGFWAEDSTNWIQGDATKVGYSYYVEEGEWAYHNVQVGWWSGYFWTGNVYPPGDTAYGDWWSRIQELEGTFWGDLADD